MLIAITVSPIVIGVLYAIGASAGVMGPGANGFSTQRVAQVFASSETWRSALRTVMVAGAATGVAVTAAVWSVESLWQSALGRRLVLLPFAVPHVAAALAILLLVGQSGLLSRVAFATGLTQSPSDFPAITYDGLGIGLMLSFVWKEFPFLALTAFAIRAGISTSVLEAGRSLGGTARQVERAVVRPLIVRGVLPATIAVFAFLLGQYEMPSVLGPSAPPALAVLTYERLIDSVLSRRGEAYVLALLAMGLTALLVWGYNRAISVADERQW